VHQFGNGKGYSVLEVIEASRRVSGAHRGPQEPPRPGDPSHLVACADKADGAGLGTGVSESRRHHPQALGLAPGAPEGIRKRERTAGEEEERAVDEAKRGFKTTAARHPARDVAERFRLTMDEFRRMASGAPSVAEADPNGGTDPVDSARPAMRSAGRTPVVALSDGASGKSVSRVRPTLRD